MTLRDRIGLTTKTDEQTQNEDSSDRNMKTLKAILRERESTLRFTATYTGAGVDPQGEWTASFVVSLEDMDGEFYGERVREFRLPEKGLREDSPLSRFLDRHGINAVDDLDEIIGETQPAELTDDGRVRYLDPGDDNPIDANFDNEDINEYSGDTGTYSLSEEDG